MLRCPHCTGIIMNFMDEGDTYHEDSYRCINCGREAAQFKTPPLPLVKEPATPQRYTMTNRGKGNICVDCKKVITDTAKRCHPCSTIQLKKLGIKGSPIRLTPRSLPTRVSSKKGGIM
jgi:hypothetical protein